MMLDFSWSHILILMVVALVVVGPKDLPRLMRIVGQWMGKARAMANEFRKSFDDMARQSELDELRKEIETLRNVRPFEDVERDLNRSIIPDEMRDSAVMRATVPPPGSVSIVAEPADAASPLPEPLPEPGPEPRAGEFAFPEPHSGSDAHSHPVAADGHVPPPP